MLAEARGVVAHPGETESKAMNSSRAAGTMRVVTRRSAGSGNHSTVRYRIVVRGEIRSSMVGPLAGITAEPADETTDLVVDIVDQSHLQGVISALADRGIDIISLGVEQAI